MVRVSICICMICLVMSCDPHRVMDESKLIPGNAWYYKDQLLFDVIITDTGKLYNAYLNLRVNGEYKYANIFLLVHQTDPLKNLQSRRVEVKLADDDGRWLGKGLGDLHEYTYVLNEKMRFPRIGVYRYGLEQNMRDDTLKNVISAGVRVEEWHQVED